MILTELASLMEGEWSCYGLMEGEWSVTVGGSGCYRVG